MSLRILVIDGRQFICEARDVIIRGINRLEFIEFLVDIDADELIR